MITLGKIITIDMVLNNPDRIPTLWDKTIPSMIGMGREKGNPTNLIFEVILDYKCDEKSFGDQDYA